MNIYLVSRVDAVDWDEYDSAIVVAEDPMDAIKVIEERNEPWGALALTVSEVKPLVRGVVLASFNAG